MSTTALLFFSSSSSYPYPAPRWWVAPLLFLGSVVLPSFSRKRVLMPQPQRVMMPPLVIRKRPRPLPLESPRRPPRQPPNQLSRLLITLPSPSLLEAMFLLLLTSTRYVWISLWAHDFVLIFFCLFTELQWYLRSCDRSERKGNTCESDWGHESQGWSWWVEPIRSHVGCPRCS